MIKRTQIAALALSAAALVGLALDEGYTDTAAIPMRGDVPTVGFGSTIKEDGTSVQMGDTITPPAALARTLIHIQKDETGIKECVTADLSQIEYDLMVDFTYQYGVTKLCKSSIVRHANAGRYGDSCSAYLLYKKQGGRDCSLPENWGPDGCKGVWTRSQQRYMKCLIGAGLV